MTREEREKRVEELEQEYKLLEAKEITKHSSYYDKKVQLSIEEEQEKIEKLRVEIRQLSEELVNIMRRKVAIRQELQQLNSQHEYLQYAK